MTDNFYSQNAGTLANARQQIESHQKVAQNISDSILALIAENYAGKGLAAEKSDGLSLDYFGQQFLVTFSVTPVLNQTGKRLPRGRLELFRISDSEDEAPEMLFDEKFDSAGNIGDGFLVTDYAGFFINRFLDKVTDGGRSVILKIS